MNMYSNNLVRITWGGVVSDYFSAVNEVKQGGVLSPVLYCVYIAYYQTRKTKGVRCSSILPADNFRC